MKKMINRIFGVLLIATVAAIIPLHGIPKKTTTVEVPVEHVTKEISLLNQIVEQAEKVVNAKTKKAHSIARAKLVQLMHNKNLDTKIKDAINEDIEIIQSQ